MKPSKIQESSLPKFEELIANPEDAFKNDVLNALVNKEPPSAWFKLHPASTEKKKIKYITIEKVEFLLTKLYSPWHVEVIEFKQLFNSVSCHVRLHLTHPYTNEKFFQDGVGAVNIQVDKGESAADFSKIKHNAVQLALPAAKSYAIKDAAEHLGKLFGRDMNREDVINSLAYEKTVSDRWTTPEEKRLVEKINSCQTLEELCILQENNPNFPVEMFEERKEILRNATEL